MQTSEEEARAMIDAERREVKEKKVSSDVEFMDMMNSMLSLSEKYGTKRLIAAIMDDYRNTKWIHLFNIAKDE